MVIPLGGRRRDQAIHPFADNSEEVTMLSYRKGPVALTLTGARAEVTEEPASLMVWRTGRTELRQPVYSFTQVPVLFHASRWVPSTALQATAVSWHWRTRIRRQGGKQAGCVYSFAGQRSPPFFIVRRNMIVPLQLRGRVVTVGSTVTVTDSVLSGYVLGQLTFAMSVGRLALAPSAAVHPQTS